MTDNLKGKFDYTARVLDRTDFCDLSDDYTLPDYMPAIGRVISCSATAAPPALYLGGGNIEFAGGVRYLLHYESAEDSTLWCAELPSEYDHLIYADRIPNLPSDPSDIAGLVSAEAENVSARITAPRRLTVKSKVRLGMGISCASKFETAFRGDADDTDALRYLEASSPYGINSCGTSAPIICRDKIAFSELGLSDTDTCRVISSRAKVMINRAETNGNSVDCKGEINACMLYTSENENERPRRITRRIPFSAEIPMTNLPAVSASPIGVRAYGICPTVTATSGEDGINLETALMLSAESAWMSSLSYLKDVYSQTAECELSKAPLEFRIPLACFNGNATISAQSKLDTLGLDGGMKLLDYNATVLPNTEWEITDSGKFVLNGKMKVTAVADNGAELLPAEFESDFKYTADIPDAKGAFSPKINVIADVSDIKCRLDSDRIYADCELCVSVLAEDEKKVSAVSEVNLTAVHSENKSASRIIVCYPAKGETLWDVAKRYRADVNDIAENNSLSVTSPDASDSLAKSKFLII
ncbi:MAG: DUF3794 domain-containing protein [Clostridia bacterium]|nr:DUF3794 domain-containing protein [Clostridia bacterium]